MTRLRLPGQADRARSTSVKTGNRIGELAIEGQLDSSLELPFRQSSNQKTSMKRPIMSSALSTVLALMSVPALAQTDLYLENPSYNTNGNVLHNYTGNVGNNFQVVAADVPAGDSVEVTALGFYAYLGTTVNNHTLSLWGPSATSGGNLGSLNLASVTLSAGATADANGFAWVTLSTPITLVSGDYYDLLASVTSGSGNDPYLVPYDNGSSGNPVITPDVNGVDAPFYIVQGAYSTSGYAYTWSTYLGPNLQYEEVPEPSTMALGGIGLMALMVYRRRTVN
jgi:hypothetical protein